jgi:ABC-type transport system involved in multi-copper enzyme maturation permease subunit
MGANPQPTSKSAFIFGGMSFIPLVGIIFGAIAIFLGIRRKQKSAILIGISGIFFTVILYSFLFSKLLDKSDPAKVELTQLILNESAIKIYGLKQIQGTFPASLSDIPTTTYISKKDSWLNDLQYSVNGDIVVLKSAGADGQFGTSDDLENKHLVK